MTTADPGGPLLVFGPRSTTYDFGPEHPLTPRRFGPGIDLLRSVGATPGLAPEPASDGDLLAVHSRHYVDAVRRLSAEPGGPPEAGIGPGDDPPFAGMHEAGAMVAGGSLRAIEAILRGDVEHAFHPGGGLHHAMRSRASGFCIYDDPALAIARARRDGLRVLYVDLDVHHGDGVQAIHLTDPGVVTISFHETGRALFPGTGFPDELGEGEAAATSVNIPFEPFAGDGAWLPAVRTLVPDLAAAFGPDLVVSQHGSDAHAWDPLAHLRLTTTAMGEAARLVDTVAHRFAGGRWLATGGGGYDAYRVVPRAWAHVWLAGAGRDAPSALPAAWRERWAAEAERHGQAPLPGRFDDAPNAGLAVDGRQQEAEARSAALADLVDRAVVPAILREARLRGWWRPLDPVVPPTGAGAATRTGGGRRDTATIVEIASAGALDRLSLAPRVIAPADASAGLAILRAAVNDGSRLVAAVAGSAIVGVALAAPLRAERRWRLVALGVAPDHRRAGLAGDLLRRLVAAGDPIEAVVTVAERDPVEPLPRGVRVSVASRLLAAAGFRVERATSTILDVDRDALAAHRA